MSWPAMMVRALLELRDEGEVDFDQAWRRARVRCGREAPVERLTPDLRNDPGYLTFAAFFRRACWREWHGCEDIDYAGLRDVLEPPPGVGPRGRTAPGVERVRRLIA